MARKTLQERFDAKWQLDPKTGCHVWTASLDTHGYAQISDGAHRILAHRLAYEQSVGPIPEGLQIDHLCRVRHCVNPTHLEPVTQQENIRRGEAGCHEHAKTHCPKGHPYSGDNLVVRNKRGGGEGRICRECKAAFYRSWQAAHREDRRAYLKAWREANREKIKAYRRAYRARKKALLQ